jgi:tRNA uridine 5-carboxymethylaminomethyl modification enzyme
MIFNDLERIANTRISLSDEENEVLSRLGIEDVQKGTTLEHLLKRSDISYSELAEMDHVSRETPAKVREQVEIQTKYRGYIDRQLEQVERSKKMETTKIPVEMNYESVKGLTTEVREKLEKGRPDTLGQASRIPGMTPAAISILAIALKSGVWKSGSR